MTSLSFSPSPRLRPRLDRLYALWHEKNEGTIRTMLVQEVLVPLAQRANSDQLWKRFQEEGEETRSCRNSWDPSSGTHEVTVRDGDIPWERFRPQSGPESADGHNIGNLPTGMLERIGRHVAWAQRWTLETHPQDTPTESRAKQYADFTDFLEDEVKHYVDRELSRLERENEQEELDELFPEIKRNREKNRPPPPPPRSPPAQAPSPPTPGGPKWEPPFAGRSVNPHNPHRRGPTDR